MTDACWISRLLTAARALALLGLAVAAPVVLSAQTSGARTGPTGSVRPTGGASHGPTGSIPPGGGLSHGPTGSVRPGGGALLGATARYRVVGCRSRGRDAYRHGSRRREVAIGFDDGPAPDTGAFVRMLERSHARATFFLIGAQLGTRYAATLKRALRDGDALGDHTFTHPYLTLAGDVRHQLASTMGAIRSLTGYRPCVFRPPYGAYNGSTVRIARSLGLATVLWDVDPSDYAQPGARAIERRVLSQVQPGSIIVSHDGGGPRGQTLAAYPPILAALRARGYRVVTIPELLGFRPVYAPCIRPCGSLGISRHALPRDAIVE
jgi:peptidoglycan/xylan/chitin deacetylase (PgdA/CDA1 family)